MTLPGTSLLALLTRGLDDESAASPIVSTIADLQHEALSADTAWQRWLAVLRGYSGVARLLFVDGLIWRFPMRRFIAILALGGFGAALVMLAFGGSQRDNVVFAALLLVAVATPAVFRLGNVGGSFRQMWVNCLWIGMISATAMFLSAVARAGGWREPWYAYVLIYLLLAGCVAVGGALVAAAAWKPEAGTEPVYRRRLLQVAAGSLTFAACWTAIALVSTFSRTAGQVQAWNVASIVGTGSFFAFFFAAVALAVYLPLLIGLRRALPSLDAWLPLAGAALFPIPLFGLSVLQGRLASAWHFYVQSPSVLLWTILPYVLAGAVLGWLLAKQSGMSSVAVS